jgi:4-oxalocrotonate tautomerase
MPIMQVFLMEGRTDEQRARLISALTDAAVESIGAPRETVRVIITEIPKAQFGVGEKPRSNWGVRAFSIQLGLRAFLRRSPPP